MSLMSRFLGTPWLARSPILLYRLGLGKLIGSGLVMLEHTGRKSGEPRRVVLEVTRLENEHSLIIASGFGDTSQWFKNLQANPRCRVWTNGKRGVPATAEFLNREDSDEILKEYQVTHAAIWNRLKQAITEITGEVPDHIPMVRIRLQAG